MADDGESLCSMVVNLTTFEEAELSLVNSWDRFVVTVVYPCITALGIVTNVAFCFVVGRVSRMRTITNVYLVNLAAADLTFLVVACSEKLFRLVASPVIGDETLYGLAGCILVPFVLNCTYFASIFIVTLVSVEKFYAICCPLRHLRLSSKARTLKLLLGAWLSAILCSSFFILGRARLEVFCVLWPPDLALDNLPPIVSFCQSLEVLSSFQHVANVLQTVPFFIAFVVNTILYVRILKAMHLRVAGEDHPTGINNVGAVKARNQVARMLIANGALFFLCQMLFQGISVALGFRHLKPEPTLTNGQIQKALLVARILCYLNAAVNSIVYTVFSSRYRRAFRETFCRWRSHQRIHPAHTRMSHVIFKPDDHCQSRQTLKTVE